MTQNGLAAVTVDRSHSSLDPSAATTPIVVGTMTSSLHLVVDGSVVELFLDDGIISNSFRVYPTSTNARQVPHPSHDVTTGGGGVFWWFGLHRSHSLAAGLAAMLAEGLRSMHTHGFWGGAVCCFYSSMILICR
jgi:hypothetical protein